VAYGAAGTNPSTATYSYDAAGNQTGNSGGLALTYLPTNQTQSITNTSLEPVAMTWTGAGQGERVGRTWTDKGTAYTCKLKLSSGSGAPSVAAARVRLASLPPRSGGAAAAAFPPRAAVRHGGGDSGAGPACSDHSLAA
jgi:YD repeat-containing protein